MSSEPHSIQEVDLLVLGAGAGGMTAALIAALDGLEVLLVEKTAQVGGTTSTSGGTTWVPGSHLSELAGVPDKVEDADKFLKAVVGNRGGDHLRTAFLASGRAAIRELDQKTEVKFVAAAAHPDYVDGPGQAYGGRALGPVEFDGRLLGTDFDRVRPPRREFMGLGGMMVGRVELAALLAPFASAANFQTTIRMVGRYVLDRLRYKRGTRLIMGNALVARLLFSLRKAGVPILFDGAATDLILESGRVTGAVVNGRRIRARKGVVLATGGVCWNKGIRDRIFPRKPAPMPWVQSPTPAMAPIWPLPSAPGSRMAATARHCGCPVRPTAAPMARWRSGRISFWTAPSPACSRSMPRASGS